MAKPVAKREVEKFLGNKLECEAAESGKHEGYSFPAELGIHLPGAPLLHLQHGRSDVSANIVRQICDHLGLGFNEFRKGVDCTIGASMIYRSLLWHHLVEFYRQFTGNSSAFGKILELYVDSAERSLPIILGNFGSDPLTGDEKSLAARIVEEARELISGDPKFTKFQSGRLVAFSQALEESFYDY